MQQDRQWMTSGSLAVFAFSSSQTRQQIVQGKQSGAKAPPSAVEPMLHPHPHLHVAHRPRSPHACAGHGYRGLHQTGRVLGASRERAGTGPDGAARRRHRLFTAHSAAIK